MFNFSGGLLAGQHDSQKERPPPSRPIPVTFPFLTPPQPSLEKPPPSWSEGSSSGIPAHFLGLKKPSDVSLDTLGLLNISFGPQCDSETLVPSAPNYTRPYLPPKSWLEKPDASTVEPSPTPDPPQLLCNGRKVPDHNEFYVRAKELFFKNEDAFSNLTRKAAVEKVPLRLAHFRRFWEGLDNLAYYWDNSLDEYLPPKPRLAASSAQPPRDSSLGRIEEGITNDVEQQSEMGSADVEEPRKKAKTAPESNKTMTLPINSVGTSSNVAAPARPASISSSKVLPARTSPPKVPWAVNMHTTVEKPVDLSKGSYRGYRIGNGAEMPDQYRLDCVRSFLEPITWAFGVTLVPHRRPPVLTLQNVRFPIRMNSVAWRGPTDRLRARQGFMEGPVLGVQCRPDTNFGSSGDLEAESVLDIVREIGGMLLLAQERDREGKTEIRPGEGKWWTSNPRWGGGPGGEVGEAVGVSDATNLSSTPEPEEKHSRQRSGQSSRRPKPTPAEIWKALRPGNPMWDPKIVYEAIGKDKDSEWDEVFMVSSLNHHISILKLRIHRFYIRYLTDGILPDDTHLDPQWKSPILHRTRWFDLFLVEDRTEAMRGLWGIMAYLMRAQPMEKVDVTMKNS
ncbi:hypothetical protein CC78DRAFT_530048 [Lojkania enalia]|uniref:Uncharacterized protein n=1 Tax=Lojkania enalia TaxID=147567 RepID=A0A9P4KJI4_9PLEO|nr:hypothetical protein CC78DRAFT_530048 [Didymosphaeria enalia]